MPAINVATITAHRQYHHGDTFAVMNIQMINVKEVYHCRHREQHHHNPGGRAWMKE